MGLEGKHVQLSFISKDSVSPTNSFMNQLKNICDYEFIRNPPTSRCNAHLLVPLRSIKCLFLGLTAKSRGQKEKKGRIERAEKEKERKELR